MMVHRHPNTIWLCAHPVDMRKSFDGLIAACAQLLNRNSTNGDYFVFINKRRTHLKLLCWEPCGYYIWYKRLEQGQFNWPTSGREHAALTALDFQLLLNGMHIEKSRQFKRYTHPAKEKNNYTAHTQ